MKYKISWCYYDRTIWKSHIKYTITKISSSFVIAKVKHILNIKALHTL